MSRPRSQASQLGKLLDAASQPIYVLDEDLAIVFLNQACRDWLGPLAEELPGRRCVYGSNAELTGPDAAAAALCPPPTVCEGQSVVAAVAKVSEDGQGVRQASFVPLLSGAELIGVVATVAAEDCPEVARGAPALPQAAAGESESVALHELVLRFRRQMRLTHGIDRLIGPSPAMRRVRAQVELAAGSRASVLLVGPSGSGRQHAAAAIHHGAASDTPGPLVPLACSVLGAELIQSTVRALASGGGTAGRGTLLLNEADQLPLEVQCELCNLLSARNFPFRLMAAARESLTDLARCGRYRHDLAALLSTITIELPSLAERREDLPLLAQAFLEEINSRRGRQVSGFTSEALDRLDAHAWPGNVGELARVVAEAHQRAAGREIAPDDLPEQLRLAADAAARPRRREEAIVLDEFLLRVEQELIRRAMSHAKDNKAKAARLLGLSRPRLYRRMVQLGMIQENGDVGR